MEIHSKERKMVYYPLESDEVIERDLDDFITFMNVNGHFDGERIWLYQNEICCFFDICNTTYMLSEGVGSDYPHIDTHHSEKINLINELEELEFIEKKSSTTYYLNNDLFDEDIEEVVRSKVEKYIQKWKYEKREEEGDEEEEETVVSKEEREIRTIVNRFKQHFDIDALNDEVPEIFDKILDKKEKNEYAKQRTEETEILCTG